MEARTPSGVAAELSADLPRLTKIATEHLQDPVLTSDASLETSLELLLDRLCLSIRLSKPVGLATWAEREARRLGSSQALEMADAATHVLAGEAASRSVDHSRFLAYLEVLRAEIDSAISSIDEDVAEAREAHLEATDALLAMLGERDSATCGHSKATAEWTRRLCQAMRLPAERATFVELCALLHDVGKVATPNEILLKPGPLGEEEWEIMRDHSAAGQRILERIPSLARCALVVRAHHERWDGAGYPDGLRAEAIPSEARIVAVADSFHAMISDRPYRKAIPPRQALEKLRQGRGTQWDPLVVDAMLSLFERPAHTAKTASAAS